MCLLVPKDCDLRVILNGELEGGMEDNTHTHAI